MKIDQLLQVLLDYRWLFIASLAFLVGIWLHMWWSAFRRRSRGLHSKRTGARAERKAKKLLAKAGYRILERHPCFEANLMVDGASRAFDITPDFIVARDGVSYVVEVKRTDGDAVARASNRRQVTEYLLATGMPCLLVNMTLREIQHIAFPDVEDLL